MSASAHRCSQ